MNPRMKRRLAAASLALLIWTSGCEDAAMQRDLQEQRRLEAELRAVLEKETVLVDETSVEQRRAAAARSEDGAQPADAAGASNAFSQGEVTLSGDPPTLLTKEQQEAGWINLFDGHSLFGWTTNDPAVNWSVREGVITADSGPIGLLLTTVPFADYEFVCEYRLETDGNSGVFLRTVSHPQDVATDCYEINIADAHPEGFLTGSIVGRAKPAQPIQGSGDWAELKITADGNRLTVSHNGVEVLDYSDDAGTRSIGQIGLQKNKGKIEFRRVQLRPRGLESLFNGTDLTGWREVPGSKSKFTVEEGVIRVRDGQGFLETEREFGDFVFQAKAMTHAKELNSGFFFRAQPGTEAAPSNGYEVQIHNGLTDGNRWKPNNAGTGAIFRRVEARRVVSDDNEWFTTTLVAYGPRMAVWVDGYQVVDWEDRRTPDENPRRGLRLHAGRLSLQGHDPTTDMSFRDLNAADFMIPQ